MSSADAGQTVLVVDDEQDVLDGCTRALTRLGFTVIPAGTQTEALRLAEEHADPIHLVISDVVGHYMNGRELAAKVAERHIGVRCLLMSGYPAALLVERGLIDPGTPFIQKPFESKSFAAKVRDVLASA